jgi:hypothetical protein
LRVSKYLRAIGSKDPSLEAWLLKAQSRKEEGTRADITPGGIASVLRTNNRDTDGEVIRELGFSVSLWNGKDASFSATVGSYSPHIKNSVVLSFHQDGPSERLIWRYLFEKAIEAFDPESAVVTSHDYIVRHGGGSPSDAGGWLTYKRNYGVAEAQFSDETS